MSHIFTVIKNSESWTVLPFNGPTALLSVQQDLANANAQKDAVTAELDEAKAQIQRLQFMLGDQNS